MVELVGDACIPSDLIIPQREDQSRDKVSGAMFISGAKLYFVDWTGSIKLVTSA